MSKVSKVILKKINPEKMSYEKILNSEGIVSLYRNYFVKINDRKLKEIHI